ncbi:DUF2197 domain-containing protein [Neobacillus notoginsengisoli]|uniref:DUF2197 domain-containing protein n=1 Tax=Neobacillus notoginsengisoli TaxID=1578198 RepID=A0A417YQM8_9BACI|nr:YlaI family protein [Neobacillus notoginsengisoli]RHW36549.1 DUF2197 domain-containing protein [Neobacillus notoginsengisoli]
MRVKCVICDTIETIPDDLPDAKRLRNRPIHTYLCKTCHDRISMRTSERLASGKFKLYQAKKEDDEF